MATSVVYLNEALKILDSSKPLRDTVVGVAKQVLCAAIGSAAGGLLVGPRGALLGGIAGAIIGYFWSSEYENIVRAVRSIDDREKTIITGQIQRLVGSASLEQLGRYVSTEANRGVLLNLLSNFIQRKTE